MHADRRYPPESEAESEAESGTDAGGPGTATATDPGGPGSTGTMERRVNEQADRKLFAVVIAEEAPNCIPRIKELCAQGADPNLICRDTSSSRGYVRGGLSLLTYAAQEGASLIVEGLLASGADPNRRDEHGWTPWAASTIAFEHKERIQALLKEHGSTMEGDHLGRLLRAILDGELESARELLQSGEDLRILSASRADLVYLSITNGHLEMLDYLMGNGMQADNEHLLLAIRRQDPRAIVVLLRHGTPVEEPGKGESLLMTAAGMGQMEIVQLLVEAGADVHRHALDNPKWTASHYATRGKHKEVAKWLKEQMRKTAATE